jgi:hypothetical protein
MAMFSRTCGGPKALPKRPGMERRYPMGEKEKTVGYQQVLGTADFLLAVIGI